MFACQGRDGLRAVRLIPRDRSPPEHHRSWLPGPAGPLLGDSLEGRSVGAVKGCVDIGHPRLRGTVALQGATDHGCRGRLGHSLEGGRSVGAVKGY
jgi:hypothetical protein